MIERKVRNIRRVAVAALAVSAILALRAGTRTAGDRPDEDLVAASDEIFVGTCLRTASRFESGWGMVVTDARFLVERRIKGSPPSTVTITVPGGEMPEWNLGVMVPEAPRFSAGERRLVFAWTGPDGLRQVCGLLRGSRPASDADGVAGSLR